MNYYYIFNKFTILTCAKCCPISGYEVGDRGCCGTGKIEVTFLCNRLQPTCPNVLDYVFWDSFHPTESVYRKLVVSVLQKSLDQLA